MSLLKLLLMTLGGGGVELLFQKTLIITGEYNLCASVPVEMITVQLISLATLSVTEVRLVIEPTAVLQMLTYQSILEVALALASVYSLSTAVT